MTDGTEFEDDGWVRQDTIWERLAFVIIFLILFAIAETLLWLVTVAQFLWMAFYKKPNQKVAEFGARLGIWMKRVALYQAAVTDEKPFPWAEID